MTIGEGTIDFRRVLGALERIRFAGPLIIELFDVPKKLVSHRRLLALLARMGKGREQARAATERPRAARRSRS
jgi:sugar phosphate isomerase/epimerase